MNTTKHVGNENLKRKNNSLYPEIHGTGVDKKKGIDRNKDKDKSKSKFVFTTITNSENKKNYGNINCDRSKISNDDKVSITMPVNSSANNYLKPQNHSVSHFNLTTSTGTIISNSHKSNNAIFNLKNTNQGSTNVSANYESSNIYNNHNKLLPHRSFSLNKLKISSGFSNTNKNPKSLNHINYMTNRDVSIKTRAISEDPGSKELSRNKMVNHPLITQKEMLTDYWQCGGDLNNLRERIKNKKKSLNGENENEIKNSIEQIQNHIQNANNYINNIYKNYRERFRNSIDTNISDYSVADITCKLKISDDDDDDLNSINNECRNSNKQLILTEPKPKIFEDSSSKRRLSLPNNFQYSAEFNPFYSTQTSKSNNNDINECSMKKEDNRMSVDHVNKFSFDNVEDNLETYYKNNKNKSDEVIQLDNDQAKSIEIINTKMKEKEKDLEFVCENFNLLIEHDHKKKEQNEKMIREFTENQFLFMKRLAHLEAALKNKTNENNSLSLSLQELMIELERGESHRRKLHNYIQELRGNIRVFCRVKPNTNEINNTDDQTQINSIVRYPELTTANSNNSKQNKNESIHLFSVELINKEANSANNLSSTFHFDRIFTEITSQKEIFQEIKPFIQSALDGENICIFAYGATGSGKTYTMQGPSWALDDKELSINEFSGILPRSASYIFDELTRLNQINYSCKISISAIEIYNENIYDLFDTNSNKQPLQIFFTKNVVQLKNLIWHQLNNKEDVIKYTKEASETRRSDNTKYNENSSRSHAVYQVKLEFVKNQKHMESIINIIDLAGSERCSLTSFNNKTKEEIETMKKLQGESNFINKSLTTLGRVISMLADKKMSKLAIPYRESKLTMILQNSLKATSKTAMIVTICSDNSSLQQSKETLKFAANAMMAC